jgi:hypothetical protein
MTATRPRTGLVIAIVAGLIGAVGLVGVQSGGHSARSETTIVLSLHGDLATTLAPANLKALLALERQIAALPAVKAVSGPASFIAQAGAEANRAIAQQLARPGFAAGANRPSRLKDLLVRYGYVGLPSLSNESFVGELVFGSGSAPKLSLARLFPDGNDGLVTVRPRAGLTGGQMRALTSRIAELASAAPLIDIQTRVSEGLPK